MKDLTMVIGIILLAALGGYFVWSNQGGDALVKGDTVAPIPGVQNVVLGVKNANYHPSIITVKAGQPVSITLDSSVRGCLRSFTIKDLGVNEYSSSPSETIDFTPAKKGAFRFACSMGMGYGTIVVE